MGASGKNQDISMLRSSCSIFYTSILYSYAVISETEGEEGEEDHSEGRHELGSHLVTALCCTKHSPLTLPPFIYSFGGHQGRAVIFSE